MEAATEENNVTTLPTRLPAGARPVAIVPTNLDDVYRLSSAIAKSGMAPKDMKSPEQIMVAIMHGLEVGLPPMQALQRIAVINGRPTLWGDAAMALVRSSGKVEWIKERIEGAGDDRVAICESKRKGDPEIVRRTFSVADAKKARLWDARERVNKWVNGQMTNDTKPNDAPWFRFAERMMQMRARAFCLRDLYADVLSGMYIREELYGVEEDEAIDVTPAAPNTDPEKVTRAASRPGPPPAAVIEHKPAAPMEKIIDAEPTAAERHADEHESARHTIVETGFPAEIVEDAKPAAAPQQKRRPGPPPGARTVVSSGPAMTAQQAVADVQKAFPGAQHVETRPAPVQKQIDPPSPEDLRKRFVEAAAKAMDMDALNEAYEQIVGPHEDGMFPPDREDLLGIFTRRERELEE